MYFFRMILVLRICICILRNTYFFSKCSAWYLFNYRFSFFLCAWNILKMIYTSHFHFVYICMVWFLQACLFCFILDPQYLKRKMAKLGNSANTEKISRYLAENMAGTGKFWIFSDMWCDCVCTRKCDC